LQNELRDTAAFQRVFDTHAAMVWRTVRHLGVHPSEIEDVCQEVFVVVHRRLPEFDVEGPASMTTWLYAVCVNVIRNHVRRAYRSREESMASPPEPAADASHEDALDRARAATRLQRKLAMLDDDKREVFLLHDVEGVAMKEIAVALGIPLQTGYSRLRVARQRLEAELAKERSGHG
jgi:RNA polymerase sigma-70 factor (ECF subfamily)